MPNNGPVPNPRALWDVLIDLWMIRSRWARLSESHSNSWAAATATTGYLRPVLNYTAKMKSTWGNNQEWISVRKDCKFYSVLLLKSTPKPLDPKFFNYKCMAYVPGSGWWLSGFWSKTSLKTAYSWTRTKRKETDPHRSWSHQQWCRMHPHIEGKKTGTSHEMGYLGQRALWGHFVQGPLIPWSRHWFIG